MHNERGKLNRLMSRDIIVKGLLSLRLPLSSPFSAVLRQTEHCDFSFLPFLPPDPCPLRQTLFNSLPP